MKIEQRFKLAVLAIVAVMLFSAAMTLRENAQWESTFEHLSGSISREQDLDQLLTLLRDAETGQRGFVITGKDSFLAPYLSAVRDVPAAHASLLNDFAGSPQRLEAITEIFRVVELKLSELEETIRLRRQGGFAVVEPIVSAGRGKQYMDALRELIGEQARIESVHREQLRAQMQLESKRAFYFVNGAVLLNFFLLVGLMTYMFRLLKDRAAIAVTLQQAAGKLSTSAADLEHRNRQMALGAEMLQALGTVSSMEETADIISVYCARILPGLAGALYLYRNSRDLLEPRLSWGPKAGLEQPFEPIDCWALRRGQPHHASGPTDLCCAHYRDDGAALTAAADERRSHGTGVFAQRLCIPLVTHGEVIGMLHLASLAGLDSPGSAQAGVMPQQEAIRLAEQISLALSNVKLRETLLRQSIIDPLTGMYNRRYMDETLGRELPRAERKQQHLSVIMLDLDHFKRINDTYGHDAGDFVLKSVAMEINRNIRESDLACRFGGEEMILILPECDLETAVQRAETLRLAIGSLALDHGGRPVGTITASFGVATFPQQAHDGSSLLQVADEALYQAKHGGRNKVVAQSIHRAIRARELMS